MPVRGFFLSDDVSVSDTSYFNTESRDSSNVPVTLELTLVQSVRTLSYTCEWTTIS